MVNLNTPRTSEKRDTYVQPPQTPSPSEHTIELSIVIPCLNEAETIETVVTKAVAAIHRLGIQGEVIVADNGSTDGSQDLARQAGARVVDIPQRGYGAALRGGIAAAQGTYVIMGDADDSYDFSKIDPFIEQLRAGNQLVMGTRLKGEILQGAMPWLHQYIGNPFLTWLGNLLLKAGVSDYHCGLRGFNREAILALELRTSGMEFASEMVAKAALNRLQMSEVPIIYHPDGRSRPPHLRTWRDGWRHLKFLLLMSPYWTFILPGLFITVFSVLGLATYLVTTPPEAQTTDGNIAGLVLSSVSLIVGLQVLIFGLLSRLFAVKVGLLPHKPIWDRVAHYMGLDNGIVIGVILIVTSVLVLFNGLSSETLSSVVIGILGVVIGTKFLFSSFVISLLKIQENFN